MESGLVPLFCLPFFTWWGKDSGWFSHVQGDVHTSLRKFSRDPLLVFNLFCLSVTVLGSRVNRLCCVNLIDIRQSIV